MPNRQSLQEEHNQPPSTAKYMMRAFRRRRPLPNSVEFPDIVERWSGFRIEARHADLLRETMGVGTDTVLYPHVAGFRLQMAALTHSACPLPIWNALQIRNRMIRHRHLEPDASYVLETRVGAQRPVEKGLELDLNTRLLRGEQCDWESVVTYFYRGRFGAAVPQAAQPASPDLSGASVAGPFKTPGSGRWAFGSLTGDYNGIHLWDAYARRFGFPAAFMHPQRAIGLCLARADVAQAERQSLSVWIKGPVFYDTDVVLLDRQQGPDWRFGLSLAGDIRHAIAGVWSNPG